MKMVSYAAHYNVDAEAITNHFTNPKDSKYRKEILLAFMRYDLEDLINIFCQDEKAFAIDYFVSEMEHVKKKCLIYFVSEKICFWVITYFLQSALWL